MGDELRSRLGLASKWIKKEIREYLEYRNREMGPEYSLKDIPVDEPWKRARYLDKKLNIKDGSRTEEEILKIEESTNKVLALITLEKINITKFY